MLQMPLPTYKPNVSTSRSEKSCCLTNSTSSIHTRRRWWRLLGCGIYSTSTRWKQSASFSGCAPTTSVWCLTTTRNSLGPGCRGPSEVQCLVAPGDTLSPTPPHPSSPLSLPPSPSPVPPHSFPFPLSRSRSLRRHSASESARANDWRYRVPPTQPISGAGAANDQEQVPLRRRARSLRRCYVEIKI